MGEETFRFWTEIVMKNYQFDRREQEIEVLKGLKMQEIVKMYNEKFITANKAKRLSIHAFGKNHPFKKVKSNGIADVKTFKGKMKFYPNIQGDPSSRVYLN